ncbi:hypothetical protein E2C01_067622 [Portunus trituberculatus]|uniref:Uncharacterized protein n=1 Tax=Portunus trituberculatus TaxID=210409 RepID=A0A5B7HU55_PORTR|nr:hypothetical protein [Portunus trituberculatus]
MRANMDSKPVTSVALVSQCDSSVQDAGHSNKVHVTCPDSSRGGGRVARGILVHKSQRVTIHGSLLECNSSSGGSIGSA